MFATMNFLPSICSMQQLWGVAAYIRSIWEDDLTSFEIMQVLSYRRVLFYLQFHLSREIDKDEFPLVDKRCRQHPVKFIVVLNIGNFILLGNEEVLIWLYIMMCKDLFWILFRILVNFLKFWMYNLKQVPHNFRSFGILKLFWLILLTCSANTGTTIIYSLFPP